METELQKSYDCENTYILERHYKFCGHNLCISQSSDSQLATSAFIWEAGLELCRYIEKQNLNFHGMKVIELGAGTGILGILAALLGGNVTITDQPCALKQIQHNVTANIPMSCRDHEDVRALCWGRDHTQFPSDHDFILGGEIIYCSKTYHLLVRTLQHLSSERTTIYLASTMWSDFQIYQFYEAILPEHFNCELVQRNEDDNINVYKVTKKYSSSVNQL